MPDEFCDVSVIIPAYQAEATIGRTLRSIFAQTLKPREIVIVDDGSTDGTIAAVDACRDDADGIEIVLLHQENKGAGAARNKAIFAATYGHIAFIDADDTWLPIKLARSMDVMSEKDVTLSAHDYFDTATGEDIHVNCVSRYSEPPDPYTSLYVKGYIPSCSVVAKKEPIVKIGGFDETLRSAQDFELWLRLLRESDNSFVVFGEPLLKYYRSPNSIMTFTERRLECCERIAVKHFDAVLTRVPNPWQYLIRRMAAIHMEAASVYWKQRDVFNVLRTLLLFPFRTCRAGIRAKRRFKDAAA